MVDTYKAIDFQSKSKFNYENNKKEIYIAPLQISMFVGNEATQRNLICD